MTMKTQCRDAIYSYADAEAQINAAISGDHKEYVQLVLALLRDQYHVQVNNGDTNFIVPDFLVELLNAERPW